MKYLGGICILKIPIQNFCLYFTMIFIKELMLDFGFRFSDSKLQTRFWISIFQLRIYKYDYIWFCSLLVSPLSLYLSICNWSYIHRFICWSICIAIDFDFGDDWNWRSNHIDLQLYKSPTNQFIDQNKFMNERCYSYSPSQVYLSITGIVNAHINLNHHIHITIQSYTSLYIV